MDLRKFLTTLPIDKVAHFLGGAVIVALAAPFGPTISLVSLTLIALLKEVIDEVVYGGFDGKDFVATMMGGALMAMWIFFAAAHIKT